MGIWGRGPWARGAPTSGRQQREAAEQQQRQRDGALHGVGEFGRRTKGAAGSGCTLWPGLSSQREAPARRVQLSRPEEARRGRGPRGPSLRHCATGGAQLPRLSCRDARGAPRCETCPATHLGAAPHARSTSHQRRLAKHTDPAELGFKHPRPLRNSPLPALAPFQGSFLAARKPGNRQVWGWHQRLGSNRHARIASQVKQTPNTRGVCWTPHNREGLLEKSLT